MARSTTMAPSRNGPIAADGVPDLDPELAARIDALCEEGRVFWDRFDADVRQDPGLRVLARCGAEIVGFTALAKDRDWYIRATGVRPDFRWRRIGTVLVHLGMAEMKRRGAARMCVSNCPIEFYKVVDGEVVRRYVTLTKRLADS